MSAEANENHGFSFGLGSNPVYPSALSIKNAGLSLMKDEVGLGRKNRQRLFLGVGTVAKRLVGRLAATAHEGSLLYDHTAIGKLDAHMPANTQRATLDYSHDHLGFYRYKGFFHSCSFFSFLLTKQPMTPFCLFYRPGQQQSRAR